ncbi:hypothetical protein [Mycoplasma mycoides]|uniref:hypothetical protein n=1 Tax=Mycoplasma mycoides TaxID=2102 RepID=UPI0001793D79|nr:hypothetical protein [Mycoplasma mycoides]ADH21697.1 putative liporotein [synthetic Mycoplasma mycoides JCVI-syn1.0]ACU78850.1 putative liporotein [Mycoplasma mycoides subsp. capri str. GM12]ACU79682.1 putative liporotein [Mycoplasma mycoides subsp. capri str. GM12]SRX61197.1 hypothetical protein MMC68C_00275 [Mycoplasma mycoides subsp. capri]SRX61379.1 hypothetical protein MMC68I_00278 [Mycoplasma mycoides subsp. capri]
MKKLITLSSSIGLTFISSFLVISCKSSKQINTKEMTNITKKDQISDNKKEDIKNDKLKEKNLIIPKKSKDETFELIRKYGKEIADFLFPYSTKLADFRSKPEYKEMLEFTGKITKFYFDMNNSSSLEDFIMKKKLQTKLGVLHSELDQIISKYEKEKDSIWKQLQEISKA